MEGLAYLMPISQLLPRVQELDLIGYTDAEVWMIEQTMRELKPTLIVEWGTNVGYSARILWECRQLLDLDCEVHSVDTSERPPVLRSADAGKGQGFHAHATGVQFHIGNGPVEAIILQRASGGVRPLLFIDDDHDYPHVAMELRLFFESMPRATMLLHDAGLGGSGEVDRAIREFLAYSGGIYSAAECERMVRLAPNGIAAW